jgi:hypothetical protein
MVFAAMIEFTFVNYWTRRKSAPSFPKCRSTSSNWKTKLHYLTSMTNKNSNNQTNPIHNNDDRFGFIDDSIYQKQQHKQSTDPVRK